MTSPVADACSLKIIPVEAMPASISTTIMPSPISTNIKTLPTDSGGSTHPLFNSLVSFDRSQQQNSHRLLVEDQRTLQLALELSIAGLNDAAASTVCSSVHTPSNNNRNINNIANIHTSNYQEQLTHQSAIAGTQQEYLDQKFDFNTLTMNGAVSAVSIVNNDHNESNVNLAVNNCTNNGINQFSVLNPLLPTALDDRSKKSQNMTECVPVPSSEHVAEIVGRQGCKIKALRAKTNTYIKTPVRGEEPVFVVTGRKEDVAKAKREILSAAEHFSLIRATRKPSIDSNLSAAVSSSLDGNNCSNNSIKSPPGPPSVPGQVTIQVRVPYRVVGLVVGPKGATIKHIQHQTQTYIVTPSREREPIFEVTGLPDNVQSARKQIEAHIALRTGNLPPIGANNESVVIPSGSPNDPLALHSLNVLSQILNDPSIDSDLLVSFYRADSMRSAFDYADETCEVGTKYANMPSFESPNNTNKINLNIGYLGNNSVQMKPYMALLHSDNSQLQNINASHQSNDYVRDLSNIFNLKKANSNHDSDFLTDLDPTHQLQQHLYLPSQSPVSLNTQLQSSSISSLNPLQDHEPFVGSYTQALSFANKTQSTTGSSNPATGGFPHIRNITHSGNISNGMARSCSSASSTASSKSANNSGSGSSSRPELMNIWKNLGDSLDADEGIGDSPNIWTLPTPLTTLTGSHCSPSTSISPTDSLLGEISAHAHNTKVGLNSLINPESNSQKNVLQQNHLKNVDAVQSLVNSSMIQRRDCLVCNNKEITAVLVPCGHNMFCMDCANRICELGDAVCPVCNLSVYHAMRILA
ncbi:uncharacterized protein LOC128869663 [Anastrepha ludens]|uniref:uncharacterized protein LOC128869663 n=1 Tax=Anastrepha ludens TaxID=28586 RepID=UPI0023B0CB4A|nr:uncharacterized protein LOC128869663 [Anastrepha ludens]XP_053968219.1 uncharacterized protein LOC128869663 [Anastrepha ludens]XP_053968220.1 uncharacterized protein LOC128869663 [Anastrepha ludens]XP_053968221.1 uncharacterized protein LOC128869663 [Anastrepha ludens]